MTRPDRGGHARGQAAWIVVVPFTPDVMDVGDLGLLVLLALLAGAVGWMLVRRWRR